ncbi:hypothetical protein [Neolewinella persica]|uniref:hypothetical protein n=1 Tax=Neolewinella persica TaxID=70998 RepID=UPI0012FC09B2|nr:hypothetical protein [Neolewinella persica]
MNHSIQANKALRRGRNSLFERPVTRSYGNRKNLPKREPVPIQVRERFREQLKWERRAELRKWSLSFVLAVLFCYLAWTYGNDVIGLIVYQPGTP